MSGTKRTILFFSSFFITILVMSIIGLLFSSFINNVSDYVYYNVVSPILFTIYFFVFIFIEGMIRKKYTKKHIQDNNVLIKAKTNGFSINGRLLIYLIIILIYFTPILRTLSIELLTIPRIVLFTISIVLVEVLLRISDKSLYVFFTKDYIIISGLDLRVSLPIIYGNNVYNDTDVYTYNDIKEYFVFPETIELYLVGEQGKLVFNIDSELSRQFVGLLQQKKIPMKKFK